MIIYGALFYLFAFVALISAVMVVVSSNPVHCVLFLILTFFSSAGLFVMLNAEFLAMMLVVVYVGAVAVLFLFVVMMLNIDYSVIKSNFVENKLVALLVAFVLSAELFMSVYFAKDRYIIDENVVEYVNNTKVLGKLIYTEYFYAFQLCGVILLIAMIGAITLTIRNKDGVRKQDIRKQNMALRDRVKLVDVESKQKVQGF